MDEKEEEEKEDEDDEEERTEFGSDCSIRLLSNALANPSRNLHFSTVKVFFGMLLCFFLRVLFVV